MNILVDFIKEYNSQNKIQLKSYDDSFTGKIKQIKQLLLDDIFLPSVQLEYILNKQIRKSKYPIEIAIAGQFSSGKSTFLNALLSKDILPTGITPVTSKVNFINYGKEFKLIITYYSGAKEYASINDIGNFTDQRKSDMNNIKYLSIQAPLEILKSISLVDTPGLNSQSHTDTQTTKNILRDVGGIIWLSLIDNAGKMSEVEVLKEYSTYYKDKALCVLNQKDKFTQQQIQTTQQYIQNNLSEYFSNTIAISSKQALNARENEDKELFEESNINEVIEFIKNNIVPQATSIKEYAIKNDLQNICDIIINSYETIINVYNSLEKIITVHENKNIDTFSNIYDLNSNDLNSIYKSYKQVIENISFQIIKNIKTQNQNFYTKDTGLFKKDTYKKHTFESYYIDKDTIYKNLFYDEVLNKQFKRVLKDFKKTQDNIEYGYTTLLEDIKTEVQKWQNSYELIRKQREISSDLEFSQTRLFAAKVYENILNSYDRALRDSIGSARREYTRFSHALEASYMQNTKITIEEIEDRISESTRLHQENPTSFTIYHPDENEIQEKLNINFNVTQVETFLAQKRNYLYKITQSSKNRYLEINIEKVAFINNIKDKYLDKIEKIKKIKLDCKNM